MDDLRKVHRLDLNLLKVFEALYRERNMTRAAEWLYLTPSAVSHAVKRLRDTVGDPLFHRVGQSMVPTPICEHVAADLIDTLHKLESTLRTVTAFDPLEAQQRFTIAIPMMLEALMAPRILDQVRPLLPKAQFAFVNLEQGDVERALTSGRADLAINISLPVKSPIRHSRIVASPLVVLAQSGQFGAILTHEEYFAARHIVVSHHTVGHVMEDAHLLQRGYNRNVCVHCQSYLTARDLISQSDYLLTLPNLLAERLVFGEVVRYPLPVHLPEIEMHIYWHETLGEDPARSWLRDRIVEVHVPEPTDFST